ncbi:MAG: adenylyltransferase/cytidyltransferase family protein [Nanoarchaeota archaeon]|nr:adenylyltransferase/cytidyltransferase family protein [Nanoarchaeota archaeon]
MKLGKVGLIGRFKPVHNGAALMLETVCEKAESVIIGIGSSNKYNARNPFLPEESEEMVRLVLEKFSNQKNPLVYSGNFLDEGNSSEFPALKIKQIFSDLKLKPVSLQPNYKELNFNFRHYEILHVPDFSHILQYSNGEKWKEYVCGQFGELDNFVTSNDFVKELLKDRYNIIHPSELIPKEKQILLKATEVRLEMARFGNWKKLVPEKISEYLEKNNLVSRFQNEFGLQTLALLSENLNLNETEDAAEEKLHAQEL